MITDTSRKSIAPVANTPAPAGNSSRKVRPKRICPPARARLMFCPAEISAATASKGSVHHNARSAHSRGAPRVQLPHQQQPPGDTPRLGTTGHAHGVHQTGAVDTVEHAFEYCRAHRPADTQAFIHR